MALVSLLAVTVGVIVAVVGLLRLGWIADFLSAPIIIGFLAGVTVIIIVHQLPDLFALPPVSGTTVHRVATVIGHLGQANGWAVGIGVAVFAVVTAAERIDRKLPGALVGLVGSTVVVAAVGLHGHGVPVLWARWPTARRTSVSTTCRCTSLGQVLPIAAVVALVVLSQTAATTRAFADQGGYAVDVNRDFVGVGAGSILAGAGRGVRGQRQPGPHRRGGVGGRPHPVRRPRRRRRRRARDPRGGTAQGCAPRHPGGHPHLRGDPPVPRGPAGVGVAASTAGSSASPS